MNMDEILEFMCDSGEESDADFDLGETDEELSDWEYKTEAPKVKFCEPAEQNQQPAEQQQPSSSEEKYHVKVKKVM